MTIAPLPQGTTTFIGLTGQTLPGGKVFTYAPGSSTPKATWQDPQQVSLNTNPVVLNANGQAVIYGWGAYRLLVEDSSGNTISDSLTFGGPLTQTVVSVVAAGAGTFTVPAGVYSIYVEAVGGGGAGANCFAASARGDVSGAGGGAGGFASGQYAVTPAQAITYSVGAGAAGGSGGTGGTTTFGSLLTCTGGIGATFVSTGTSVGGLGGSASGGNISNVTGGAGTDGSHLPPSGGAPYIGPGNGGGSHYGSGGTSVNGGTGHNGTAPGSGGGGAMDVNVTSTNFGGGGGAIGCIIIIYWS